MSDRTELAHSIALQARKVQTCSGDDTEQQGDTLRRLLDHYWRAVPAALFADSGKWEYDVTLDYTDQPPGYIAPDENARRALLRATQRETSGVSLRVIPKDWLLVVPEPPEGFPVMARAR